MKERTILQFIISLIEFNHGVPATPFLSSYSPIFVQPNIPILSDSMRKCRRPLNRNSSVVQFESIPSTEYSPPTHNPNHNSSVRARS